MIETRNIHQRLAAAMQRVTYIQKESKKGMNYTIVSHDAVTAKVRPVLLEEGIVYYPIRCDHAQNGNRAECGMTVRFVNVDEPSDFFDVQTFGYGVDTQDKGPGKAMSYAVKYALLKAMGLETGDDADHDQIEHTREDPAQKPANTFDANAVTDRIVNALNKAAQLPNVQKITFSDAFKETFARLAKDYPDHAARIQEAETAALARVDPAMQRPADEAA